MSVHERDAIYSTNSKGVREGLPKGQPVTRKSKEALNNERRMAKCPTQSPGFHGKQDYRGFNSMLAAGNLLRVQVLLVPKMRRTIGGRRDTS